MSLLLAGTIGFLTAAAVLQLLQRDVVRMVIGLFLLWNATNLLFIAVGATRATRAPLVNSAGGTMADPLVQAFILTAIVITFGFAALLAALVYWLTRSDGTIDVEQLTKEQG